MKILALETSAKAVSAAVTEDGKVLCAGYQDTGLTHSRTLMPIVEHILKNTGLTMAEIDAVAVAAGPGSFTGIRIGVAAAKGLAFAADKSVAAVSTLAAMARNVAFANGGGRRRKIMRHLSGRKRHRLPPRSCASYHAKCYERGAGGRTTGLRKQTRFLSGLGACISAACSGRPAA